MALITVTQGRREGAFDGPDGTYEVVLMEIGTPRTVTAQRGVRAGEDVELRDWVFAIASGDNQDQTIDVSLSTASGPKSNTFKYLTALLGGIAPKVGQSFEEKDLYGRMAIATIQNVEGWPRITNLSAMPASMVQARAAERIGSVAAPAAASAVARPATRSLNLQPAAAATATDELPF